VPVSVLDKQGQPVLGLRGPDFTVAEDGRRQELTYFSGERRPLRLALALDVSTSMSTKMRAVSAALQHFIDLLEPADEILVLTFSSDIHIEQDFTSNRDLLERVFSRLHPASGTALFDAAIEAIRRVAQEPAESKAVVLVTDGMDTASQSSFDELRELARRSEVPVFSLAIGGETIFRRTFDPIGGIRIPGRGPGRGPGGGWPGGGGGWPGGGGGRGPTAPSGEPDFDARPLLDLAEDTGGRAAILKGLERDRGARSDTLQEAVESIAMTLRHRYLVSGAIRRGERRRREGLRQRRRQLEERDIGGGAMRQEGREIELRMACDGGDVAQLRVVGGIELHELVFRPRQHAMAGGQHEIAGDRDPRASGAARPHQQHHMARAGHVGRRRTAHHGECGVRSEEESEEGEEGDHAPR
jgi:VWFA-related protein